MVSMVDDKGAFSLLRELSAKAGNSRLSLNADQLNLVRELNDGITTDFERQEAFFTCGVDILNIMEQGEGLTEGSKLVFLQLIKNIASSAKICAINEFGLKAVVIATTALVNHNSVEMRLCAGSTLRVLSSVDSYVDEIRKNRGLRPLIEMLGSNNESIQELAASLLERISVCDAIGANSVVELNGANAAVNLLTSTNSLTIKYAACGLLSRLPLNDKMKPVISKPKVVESLLSMILSSTTPAQAVESAAIIFSLVSASDNIMKVLEESGAVKKLVSMLQSRKTILTASLLLVNQSRYEPSKKTIVENGGLEMLVPLLGGGSNNKNIVNNALRVLKNLVAKDDALRSKLVSQRCTEAAVAILKSVSSKDDMNLIESACLLLSKLAKDDRCLKILTDDKAAVDYLVSLLPKVKANDEVQLAILKALKRLELSTAKMQDVQAAVPAYLICIWLLYTDLSNSTTNYLILLLRNMAIAETLNSDDLISLGLVPKLLFLLDTQTPSLIENVCVLLKKLSSEKSFGRHLKTFGLQKIIALLGNSSNGNEQVQLACLKILQNVADRDYFKIRIAELGAIPVLVNILKAANVKLQTHSAEILKLMSTNECNVVWMGTCGVVEALIKIIAVSKNPKLIQLACGVLADLATNEHNRKLFLSNSGARPLVALLQSANESVQEAALGAISVLVLSTAVKEAIYKAGIISAVKNIKSKSKNEYLVLTAENTLAKFDEFEADDDDDDEDDEDEDDALAAKRNQEIEKRKQEIENDFCVRYQSLIRKITGNEKFILSFDWQYFDTLSPEQKKSCIEMVKTEKFWSGIRDGIDFFTRESTKQMNAFKVVTELRIEAFLSCSLKYFGTRLVYKVGVNPGDFIGDFEKMQMLLSNVLSEEIKRAPGEGSNYSGNLSARGASPSSGDPYKELVALAKEAYKGESYLKALIDLVNKGPFCLPDEKDHNAMKLAASKLFAFDERFVKGWRVIKYNKHGLEQERYLVLSDRNYFTIKYDPQRGNIDEKHVKAHPLKDFFILDVGLVSGSKIPIPALNVFTQEAPHETSTSPIAAPIRKRRPSSVNKDTMTMKSVSFYGGDAGEPSSPDNSARLRKQASSPLARASPPNNNNKDLRELLSSRPSTEGCYSSIFVIPDSVEPMASQKQKIIEEMAWVIYGAACFACSMQLCEPFANVPITRPSAGLSTTIYNYLKLGRSGK